MHPHMQQFMFMQTQSMQGMRPNIAMKPGQPMQNGSYQGYRNVQMYPSGHIPIQMYRNHIPVNRNVEPVSPNGSRNDGTFNKDSHPQRVYRDGSYNTQTNVSGHNTIGATYQSRVPHV